MSIILFLGQIQDFIFKASRVSIQDDERGKNVKTAIRIVTEQAMLNTGVMLAVLVLVLELSDNSS